MQPRNGSAMTAMATDTGLSNYDDGCSVAADVKPPAMGRRWRHQLGQSPTSPSTGRKKRRRSHVVSSRGTVCIAKSMRFWVPEKRE
jgi:hypothetical protein